jgi:hypothetical protein
MARTELVDLLRRKLYVYAYIHIHLHIYVQIHMYMCLCVCVCVYISISIHIHIYVYQSVADVPRGTYSQKYSLYIFSFIQYIY